MYFASPDHISITKSEEAARQTKQRLEAAASLKAQRRATQEENVKRKREEVERKREEKRAKYAKKAEQGTGEVEREYSEEDEDDEGNY